MSLLKPTNAPEAVKTPGPFTGGFGKRTRNSARSIISSIVVTTIAPASSTTVRMVA